MRCRFVLSGVVLACVALSGCWRGLARDRETTGTCEGACEHYVDCKEPDNEDAVYGRCISECRQIFTEDGRPDAESLRDYERLSCPKAIAFVDGK